MMDVEFGHGYDFTKKSRQAQCAILRKSARLQLKSKPREQDEDSNVGYNFKRQKIEINQGASCASGFQTFRIENKNTFFSSTLAVRVPSDTMDDSLYCSETLPSLRAGSHENNRSSIKEEVEPSSVEIVRPHLASRWSHNEMFRFSNHFTQQMREVLPSFPYVEWTEPQELWDQLNEKAVRYPRSPMLWDHHPNLRPYMRSVLLTWMTDVCEMYRMHRETYYLAVEYTDRYLLRQNNITPSQLQLIGVAALFIASKIEEIYPPRATEFSYVCDGAVSEDLLREFELEMLQVLDYGLYPMTPNTWIQLFLQIRCILKHEATKQGSQISTFADTTPSNSSFKVGDGDLEEVGSNPLMELASYALEQEAAKENSWAVISSSSEQEASEAVIDLTSCESSESEELEVEIQKPFDNVEVGEEEEADSTDSDVVELTSDHNEDAEFDVVEVTVVDDEEHDAAEPAMMVLDEEGIQGFELSRMQKCKRSLQAELEEEVWDVKPEGVQLLEFDPDQCLQEDQQALDEERMALLEFERSIQEEEEKKDGAKSLIFPAYSVYEYLQVSRLMDSMMLDRLSLHFSYKHIAAAALMLSTDMKKWEIPMVTGVTFPEIEQCIQLMKIHKGVISRYEPQDVYVREFEGIKESDSHKIQYSMISSEIWEDVVRQTDRHWNLKDTMEVVCMEGQRCSSPNLPDSFVTPPKSTKKTTPTS